MDGPDEPEHYWNEFASYNFGRNEIITLARQTEKIHGMCVDAAHFLAKGNYGALGLPQQAFELAQKSLINTEFDFYGRLDLAYSGNVGDPVKLLEYNADTPTGIIESVVSQQTWHNARGESTLDSNDLGEALAARWRALRKTAKHDVLHLAHVSDEVDPTGEDRNNTWLLGFAAQKAGWKTKLIPIEEVIWNEEDQRWEDADRLRIDNLFKLYPWEYMLVDDDQGYNQLLFQHYKDIEHWVEPAWKMFLSHKTLLAALWELHPGHENLVEAYLGTSDGMKNWVLKPISVEKVMASLSMHPITGLRLKLPIASLKDAPDEDFVYQEFIDIKNLPGTRFENNYPILDSWVVGGRSVGVGVRESSDRITSWDARFVPHIVKH